MRAPRSGGERSSPGLNRGAGRGMHDVGRIGHRSPQVGSPRSTASFPRSSEATELVLEHGAGGSRVGTVAWRAPFLGPLSALQPSVAR